MSPVPEVNALNRTSNDAQVKAAISACISTEVSAGTPQDQAVAMCNEMVRGKTGKELAPKGE